MSNFYQSVCKRKAKTYIYCSDVSTTRPKWRSDGLRLSDHSLVDRYAY